MKNERDVKEESHRHRRDLRLLNKLMVEDGEVCVLVKPAILGMVWCGYTLFRATNHRLGRVTCKRDMRNGRKNLTSTNALC